MLIKLFIYGEVGLGVNIVDLYVHVLSIGVYYEVYSRIFQISYNMFASILKDSF